MVPWVKMLVTKPGDPSLISKRHGTGKEPTPANCLCVECPCHGWHPCGGWKATLGSRVSPFILDFRDCTQVVKLTTSAFTHRAILSDQTPPLKLGGGLSNWKSFTSKYITNDFFHLND